MFTVAAMLLLQAATNASPVRLLNQIDPLTDEGTVAAIFDNGRDKLIVACATGEQNFFTYLQTERALFTRRFTSVGQRFDAEKAETSLWSQEYHRADLEDDNDTALFAAKLGKAQRLLLRFEEGVRGREDVYFDVNARDPAVPATLVKVASACPKSKAARWVTKSLGGEAAPK